MTVGGKNNVYRFEGRIPGTKLPPVNREYIEGAKKRLEEFLKKDIKKDGRTSMES